MRHLALALAGLLWSAPVAAVVPVYGTDGGVKGQENPLTYRFFAQKTGPIEAFFAGSEAGYTSLLGLWVNGTPTGIWGLNNKTSAIGDSLSFGPVQKGDELVFAIFVKNTSLTFFSDPAWNSDGFNHIWSVPFAGSAKLPAGTFVAFEDLKGGGDRDYNDLTYVFTNVGPNAVPELSTWAMLVAGFLLVGLAVRRRQREVALHPA
ncbi:DUF4114 domain-containing protein [Thermaurantiacus sp.]